MVTLMLYNTLLLGGGRGPFALYKEHWACHCDNLYSSNDYSKILNSTEIESDEDAMISIIGSNDESLPYLISSPNENTSNTDDLCKRKQPLKYLSIIASNVMNVANTYSYSLPERQYTTLYIFKESLLTLVKGFKHTTIKPPAV